MYDWIDVKKHTLAQKISQKWLMTFRFKQWDSRKPNDIFKMLFIYYNVLDIYFCVFQIVFRNLTLNFVLIFSAEVTHVRQGYIHIFVVDFLLLFYILSKSIIIVNLNLSVVIMFSQINKLYISRTINTVNIEDIPKYVSMRTALF